MVLSASPRRPGRPQGSPLRVVILPSEGIPGLGWCFDGCYVAVVFWWRVVVVLSASPRRPGRPQGSPLRVVILPFEGIPGLGWCLDGGDVAVVGLVGL